MKSWSSCFLLLALVLSACNEKKVHEQQLLLDINQLIDAQITSLSQARDSIAKTSAMNGRQSFTLFLPTREILESELDMYRQLDDINKKTLRDGYTRSEVDDTKSNLKIYQFSNELARVSQVRIFYHEHLTQVKRIEGVVKEANQLYVNWKKLSLEFDEINGLPKLVAYGFDGYQKTVMRDTIHFSIRASIK